MTGGGAIAPPQDRLATDAHKARSTDTCERSGTCGAHPGLGRLWGAVSLPLGPRSGVPGLVVARRPKEGEVSGGEGRFHARPGDDRVGHRAAELGGAERGPAPPAEDHPAGRDEQPPLTSTPLSARPAGATALPGRYWPMITESSSAGAAEVGAAGGARVEGRARRGELGLHGRPRRRDGINGEGHRVDVAGVGSVQGVLTV
jgi:hypothetical protein